MSLAPSASFGASAHAPAFTPSGLSPLTRGDRPEGEEFLSYLTHYVPVLVDGEWGVQPESPDCVGRFTLVDGDIGIDATATTGKYGIGHNGTDDIGIE